MVTEVFTLKMFHPQNISPHLDDLPKTSKHLDKLSILLPQPFTEMTML